MWHRYSHCAATLLHHNDIINGAIAHTGKRRAAFTTQLRLGICSSFFITSLLFRIRTRNIRSNQNNREWEAHHDFLFNLAFGMGKSPVHFNVVGHTHAWTSRLFVFFLSWSWDSLHACMGLGLEGFSSWDRWEGRGMGTQLCCI
jgi:hypothetical protein